MTSAFVKNDLRLTARGVCRLLARCLLFCSLVASLLLGSAAGVPARAASPAPLSEEKDDDCPVETKEGKLAVNGLGHGRPLTHRRHSAARLPVAALRAQAHHPDSSRSDLFDSPSWEHAYRNGIGAHLRC
jgi:hypothetical protein